MKTSRIIAAIGTAAVVASCAAVTASAYTGYIGFQTAPYSFRNAWTDGDYGKATDYFDKVIMWGGNSEDTWPELVDNFDWDINGYVFDADYKDVEITTDGTYTVSASGFDWSVDEASGFNLIFVSTDIPNDGTVTIKEASVIVDGVKTYTTDSFYVSEAAEYLTVELVNIWNTEIGAYSGAYPTESLAVEFTLEGLGAPAGGDADASTGNDIATNGDAGTEGDKASPDTGVEGIAVVAGVAVIAGGALVVSKKRK